MEVVLLVGLASHTAGCLHYCTASLGWSDRVCGLHAQVLLERLALINMAARQPARIRGHYTSAPLHLIQVRHGPGHVVACRPPPAALCCIAGAVLTSAYQQTLRAWSRHGRLITCSHGLSVDLCQ